MHRRWDACSRIAEHKVVAIVRRDSAAEAARQVVRLAAAGLQVVEVSLTTPGALDVIAERTAADRRTLLGAGTVLDSAAAHAAIRAGAGFLVSPTVDEGVIRTAHRYGIPVLPGAATPSEALHALELGADLVKIFPASTWTPADLAGMLAALPQLPTVPTGGIGLDDAADWLAAGASALGIGSSLSGGDDAEVADAVARLGEALGWSR